MVTTWLLRQEELWQKQAKVLNMRTYCWTFLQDSFIAVAIYCNHTYQTYVDLPYVVLKPCLHEIPDTNILMLFYYYHYLIPDSLVLQCTTMLKELKAYFGGVLLTMKSLTPSSNHMCRAHMNCMYITANHICISISSCPIIHNFCPKSCTNRLISHPMFALPSVVNKDYYEWQVHYFTTKLMHIV